MDRTLLNKLTCSGEEMPAGYLYTELLACTNNLFLPGGVGPAGGAHSQFRLGRAAAGIAPEDTVVEILDYVTRKLERSDSDPFVKTKCLRLLKHLCERGHERIRSVIQRRYIHRIKNCQTYRGPPHPLQGDAPSAAVRAEAEACLRCLYAHENGGGGAGTPVVSIGATGRIEGFGPGALRASSGGFGPERGAPVIGGGEGALAGGGEGGRGGGTEYCGASWSSGVPSHMAGFGNPRFCHERQPSRGEQALQLISATASKILPTAVQEQLQRVVAGTRPTGPALETRKRQLPPAVVRARPLKLERWRRLPVAREWGVGVFLVFPLSAGLRNGPGGLLARWGVLFLRLVCEPEAWGQPAGPVLSPDLGGASSPASASSFSSSSSSAGALTFASASAVKDSAKNGSAVSTLLQSGEYENRVVEELLIPCGAKLTPSAATLSDFVSKCEPLDACVLGCVIQQKLEDPGVPWLSKLRLLTGCEALLAQERQRSGGRGAAGRGRFRDSDAAAAAREDASPLALGEVLAANAAEAIKACADLPQLKRPAAQVLRLLAAADGGGDSEAGEAKDDGRRRATTTSGSEEAETEPDAGVDLLDLGDEAPHARAPENGAFQREEDLLDLGSWAPDSSAGAAPETQTDGANASASAASLPQLSQDLLDVLSGDLASLSVSAQPQSAPSASASSSASSFFSGLVVKDRQWKERESTVGASATEGSLLSPAYALSVSAKKDVSAAAPAPPSQDVLQLDSLLSPSGDAGQASRGVLPFPRPTDALKPPPEATGKSPLPLSALAARQASASAASALLAPAQSRTAHLDSVFNSAGAMQLGAAQSGLTGYAALFPHSQGGAAPACAGSSSVSLLGSPLVSPTSFSKNANALGGGAASAFSLGTAAAPAREAAERVERNDVSFALPSQLGADASSPSSRRSPATVHGSSAGSRAAPGAKQDEARTKFAFVTS
ncbi:hypothetical protein BESB_015920 [Besnoitia besnoiti]|uniref:ENTH domain-containing protein n=1 Tax=Besnoitia besnoiti TaxID=94643 RepID=A0A2A9M4Y7_BESBE|nr:hypothetical protein BESB_015920 [Besnoitia besnoiti]PFH32274.1 hypothetical protein BESB_015920 [Besnoitia besnoiti]